MGNKHWYVAAGKRKAGPMTSERLALQVRRGRVPKGALAWKEGMEEWEPLERMERFRAESSADEPAPEAPSADEPAADASSADEPAPKTVKRKKRRTSAVEKASPRGKRKTKRRSSSSVEAKPSKKKRPSKARRPAVAAPLEDEARAPFSPLYRLERKDMWRAFGMGLEAGRLRLALAATGLPVAGAAAVAGLGLLAGKAHPLLAIPFFLVAPLVAYVLWAVGSGALSRYGRSQLEEGERPALGACLRYALRRRGAMSLPPLLLALGSFGLLLALGILAFVAKIPYAGPLATGALFGVHVVLGAGALFLLVAAALASVFGPVTAAFEETGAKDTARHVLDFARRSLARTLLWGFFPTFALGPFAGLLLALGALALALPLAAVVGACGPELVQWILAGAAGDPPLPMALPMAYLIVLWTGVLLVAILSVVASVHNALTTLLYVGGREGNDALISRDAFLERRNGGVEA